MNKKSCDDAIANVYLYLDGEIGVIHRAKIAWHLRHCQGCFDAYQFETHLKSVIRDRVQEEPKQEVIDRLKVFLEENEPGFGS